MNEKEKFILNNQDMKIREIAKILNISISTVSHYRKKLGLTKKQKDRVQTAIYAMYKGDDFIMDGTIREIAKYCGVKEETIRFMTSPTYERRCENAEINKKNKSKGRKILIRVE